jgi:ABC-type branched-subunit amino acid transport system substrate-binding protein
MRRPLKIPALVLAGALMLAACGSSGGGNTASVGGNPTTGTDTSTGTGTGTTGADGVKTGPGVTADTITLGVMTDLTGPFKDFSTNLVAGHQMWVDEANAKGGICKRQIKLNTLDHGYKADTATVQFPDLEPKVAGFMQLLGSPVIAALKTDINDKKVTTLAISWSSLLLDQPYVTIVGTTYDLEMLNALNYLLDKGLLKQGDTIGHIYIDGEYGGNGLLGSKYFAAQHGMKIDEGKVTATDTDMKSIVTKFKGDKVKAIALTTSPAQTASAASNNAALGLKVPMVGNSPVFAPALLGTPAAPALQGLYVAASAVPFTSDVAKAKQIATAFIKAHPELKPSFTVQLGYAFGEIWGQILTAACKAKDLSRAGIHDALKGSSNITTDKLIANLDYTKPGSPASRQVYVTTVDKATPGGLKQAKALYESADAKTYKAPTEK